MVYEAIFNPITRLSDNLQLKQSSPQHQQFARMIFYNYALQFMTIL